MNDPITYADGAPNTQVGANTDPSPRETLTIEEAVNRVSEKVTLKLVLMFAAVSLTVLNVGPGTYMAIFTGYIPYTEWECVSVKCSDLLAAAGSTKGFYSYDTMCNNNLISGSDFQWTSKTKSFSTQWGFYCKNEAKLSLFSSVHSIGTFLGAICSTGVYERIGRKKGAIVGSFITLIAVAASAVANNYYILLLLRIMYGFGMQVTYMGSYCWIVETAPTYLRNPISNLFALGWSAGIFALIGISYFIHDWHYVHAAVACVDAVAILPFFLLPLPESPRFSLLKGKEEESKKTLKVLARLSGTNVSLDKVDLVYEEKDQSYVEQIKDFKSHPTMLKETLTGMIIWFIVSLIFYSYQYGWSKMGHGLHSIYSFSALGEAISFVIPVPCCRLLGRKKATIFFFGLIVVMNGLAMLNVKLADEWNLEHLASLIGSIGGGAAYNLMFLYTGELAPTSHRGMILCLSACCAEVGSFIGPYVNLLYGTTDRRVPLTLFAGLSVLAIVALCFLPDTTGRCVPETPGDVEMLAEVCS